MAAIKQALRTAQARLDIEYALDYYALEAPHMVDPFLDALERAIAHIQRTPGTGSPRYAHELDLPGLRFWTLSKFPLPTSSDYYYPDFVCELKDGRLLVVEYKGGDRLDGGDAIEKARIGERWAATSKNKRCIFVQVSKADPLKRSLEKQLKDALL